MIPLEAVSFEGGVKCTFIKNSEKPTIHRSFITVQFCFVLNFILIFDCKILNKLNIYIIL